jgi:uncharacterized OB-fold protein
VSTTAAIYPPLPGITALTQFFWDGVKERKLMILQCQNCGHHVHVPRPVCNRCRSLDLAPAEMSGQATLYAYTVVMQVFHPFYADKVPYTLAVVELAEEAGLRMTTQIIDCDEADLRTGMEVEVIWTEVAPDFTLPYFRPSNRSAVSA